MLDGILKSAKVQYAKEKEAARQKIAKKLACSGAAPGSEKPV